MKHTFKTWGQRGEEEMNEFCRKILFNDVLIRDSVYDKSVD